MLWFTNIFSITMNTMNLKMFPDHGGTYERNRNMRGCILEFNPEGGWDILWKKGSKNQGGVDFEIRGWGTNSKLVLEVKENFTQSLYIFTVLFLLICPVMVQNQGKIHTQVVVVSREKFLQVVLSGGAGRQINTLGESFVLGKNWG